MMQMCPELSKDNETHLLNKKPTGNMEIARMMCPKMPRRRLPRCFAWPGDAGAASNKRAEDAMFRHV